MSASPRVSNPGPRLAVVAGVRTDTFITATFFSGSWPPLGFTRRPSRTTGPASRSSGTRFTLRCSLLAIGTRAGRRLIRDVFRFGERANIGPLIPRISWLSSRPSGSSPASRSTRRRPSVGFSHLVREHFEVLPYRFLLRRCHFDRREKSPEIPPAGRNDTIGRRHLDGVW